MLHKKNILSEQLLLVLTNKINQYADLLKRLMERRFFKDLTYIIQPQTQRLDDLNNRLFRGLEQSVILQKQNMMSIIHQFIRLNPLNNIQKLIEKKELLLHLLVQNIQATVRLDRERFDGISKNLNALSPLAILDRGYSITSFQGKSLAKTNQIKQGDSVNIRLSKGQLDCTVDKVTLFK